MQKLSLAIGLVLVGVLGRGLISTSAQSLNDDIRVVDGDTLEITHDGHNEKVRLACIDAPESSQQYGKLATAELEELVKSGTVIGVEVLNRDRYDRAIGVVHVDGKTAQQELVSKGLAYVYHEYKNNCPTKLYTKLSSLEQKASNKRVGVWSDPHSVKPWAYRRK